MSRTKNVMLMAPKSTGGNFEYVALPRQGLPYISGALKQWEGEFLYDRQIWYEDRNGYIDTAKDLEDVDLLMITALINEAPRAYEIARTTREHHPDLKIIGGGPHMSPLAEEALREGKVDVVVIREGEDVIGPLSDVMLNYQGADLVAKLHKIPGIAFLEDGNFVETHRRGIIQPNFVELPDFDAMRDLTPRNPLAAGVIETVRGCTEKCTYCQVIQHFLGYRMVPRETELRRLAQIRKMAEDGLIYTAKDGRFSVFISDDLHPPPLRAVNYRNERLARLKGWKGHTDGMWMVCQTRVEIGQDPELAQAMLEAGIKMLYVGVESSNAQNLEAVKKRQDPGQVHRDLVTLNKMGFVVAAMTIIGLPYDTEESIMEMAEWARTVSRYQTANILTPLPATMNWDALIPLDEDGAILPEGKMRPYHLYTGKQLVHWDKRWGLQQSRELYARYTSRLRPVDKLYERIFKMFRSKAYHETIERRRTEGCLILSPRHTRQLAYPRIRQLEEAVSSTISQVRESVLSTLSELAASVSSQFGQPEAPGTSWVGELRSSVAANINELQETISTRMEEIGNTLSSRIGELRETISSTTGELRDSLSSRMDEIGESVSTRVGELRTSAMARMAELRETIASRAGETEESLSSRMSELGESVSARLGEMGEAITATINDFKRRMGPPSSSTHPESSSSRRTSRG
ncbi:radical SAM protein [Chloroflexota bacterium]